jgi:hypothetical protein
MLTNILYEEIIKLLVYAARALNNYTQEHNAHTSYNRHIIHDVNLSNIIGEKVNLCNLVSWIK